MIEIGGTGVEPFALPLSRLATLPRCELTANFHCVAGWSATGLHWEGVAFQAFFREIIEPSLHRDSPLIKRHPRARVWEEERHPSIPPRLLRPLYRLTIPFGVSLARRGRR